jgi:hypothetical protein
MYARSAAGPTLLSAFPLGGAPGSTLRLSVRGENLQRAYQVLFDCSGLTGEVRGVEDIEIEAKDAKDGEQPKRGQSVSLEVSIAAAAQPGAHAFRLVTPLGVSAPLWFLVNTEPIVAETAAKHDAPADAQFLPVPVVVNGTLSKPGEVDFYAFEVQKGQKLQFEVITFSLEQGSVSADPELILYEPGKSWFSAQKGARLEADDQSRPGLGDFPDVTAHRLPRLKRVFEKGGRYLAEVGTVEGEGGPGYSYQLRIVPLESAADRRERWGPIVQAHGGEVPAWRTRSFPGALELNRIEQLAARGAAAALAPSASIPVVHEDEPNGTPDRALAVKIPAIMEGILQSPGDVDYYSFQAEPGQKLAFEIETPYLPPPYFNPRVAVFDSAGKELLTNIHNVLGGDGDDWLKFVEPKVVYTFQEGGEYRLQVRDLTSRLGGADFAYRILIRPQVPHVGKVEARSGSPARILDHINLAAGESQRVSVDADLEEGFEGEVAVTVENLPAGVGALAAISDTTEKATAASSKPGGDIHKERFRAPRFSATIIFIADPDARPTAAPRMIELKARPIGGGKNGGLLPVQSIPLAVTPPVQPGSSESPKVESSQKQQ